MIIMNEDPLVESRIQKGRTSHQRATKYKDIKLMLVKGSPVPSPTTTPRDAITPTQDILKMEVLPVLHLCQPTPTTYLSHQMKELEDASWLKAPRYHTPSIFISIVMKMICQVMMIYLLTMLGMKTMMKLRARSITDWKYLMMIQMWQVILTRNMDRQIPLPKPLFCLRLFCHLYLIKRFCVICKDLIKLWRKQLLIIGIVQTALARAITCYVVLII